jgi:hypothetical protein
VDAAFMPFEQHEWTSTPYDLVRAVPEWLESAYCTGQRHPRYWWLLLTLTGKAWSASSSTS